MSSLRTSIQRLRRFSTAETLNLSEVAGFVDVQAPISVRQLIGQLDRLPDSVPFHAVVVTGADLGGTVDLVVNSDGSYTFSGSMEASGLFSYSYRVVAVVHGASGGLSVAAQHSGTVYGLDTPGDRNDSWSEVGQDPKLIKVLRNGWPDISGGTMVVNYAEELAGVTGTVTDVVEVLVEFAVTAATLGASVACCLLVGSELDNAGVTLPGLGGVVGLAVVAGSVLIYGPFSVVPAIVVGIAAGAVVDSMIKIRPLSGDPASQWGDEVGFARRVFGDRLDFDRIRVTNLSGLGGRDFTTPTVDGTILVNLGNAYDAPTTAILPGSYPVPGQVLIHELTHAWQIENASAADGYVPGLMCSGIFNQAVLGRQAYHYGPPGPPWHAFNMESQGAIVDQWFGGNGLQHAPGMDPKSPYYGYIQGDIRFGEPIAGP
ncbi:hypothetical protein [Nakamurella sp. PAMC28650]|uniref:hypothetical protein n=1 Tax=Nakamurella sp. PAMC28650 TaxID=2762325 RepID=UPI00164E804F|nr:hypothetical protein [Nakamurella sp. PAMC28650]QNK82891.1 hypothetical protein H7F38_09590 [Nakamurella sp. PAMC28650]